MAQFRFLTADVFTDRIFGGNPLAVFPEAQGLSDAQMQNIARELNLSETVFVLPADNPDHIRRLRIFTPAAEVPFAGHPTVGTAHILHHIGALPNPGQPVDIIFEENVGPVPVHVVPGEAGRSFAQLTAAQAPEVIEDVPSAAEIAAALAINAEDLDANSAIEIVSCGLAFLYVPVRDLSVLQRLQVNLTAWPDPKRYAAAEVYAWCPGPENSDFDFHTRMFAPLHGITEDPATGSAAAAFGGYLGRRQDVGEGSHRWHVAQGVEMGRPSHLQVDIVKRGGATVDVKVGGHSVSVSEGLLTLPTD